MNNGKSYKIIHNVQNIWEKLNTSMKTSKTSQKSKTLLYDFAITFTTTIAM